MYISRRPANPIQVVEDWINIQRWETQHFWEVGPHSCRLYQNQQTQVTSEHRLRSGELLAEGLAILFLEKRLKWGRQNFFFYEGAGARPDFIFNLSPNRRFGVAWQRRRYGLEARLAQTQLNLWAQDITDLTAKKAAPIPTTPISGVIAIYCFYGRGNHSDQNTTPCTRLHLADPEEEGAPMTDDEIAEIIIHHYLGATSRAGLWGYRDRLRKLAKTLQRRKRDQPDLLVLYHLNPTNTSAL